MAGRRAAGRGRRLSEGGRFGTGLPEEIGGGGDAHLPDGAGDALVSAGGGSAMDRRRPEW